MRAYNVLFLCTGNSARSILAEALLNHLGEGRFRGYSAGSFPKSEVHPSSIEILGSHGIATDGLRSKSWNEFARLDAPTMDFVFTVCDQAAGEVCPVWPGTPVTAHWGIPDPAAVEGTAAERKMAFQSAFQALEIRIRTFLSMPIADLDRETVMGKVEQIGRLRAESGKSV